MITLTTGLPGAAKSLYTITLVNDKAEKEGRAVFYHGINDLTLDWQLLENGSDWHKVPDGSIVLIDECQSTFRPRPNGSQVPEHVAKLEVHRHRGIDIYLITQHPLLIDNNVRQLVGQHFHVVRTFGLPKSTIHEWNRVEPQPGKSRKDSVRHDFIFPKSSYGFYKSAELHTVKARIPTRVIFMFLLPVIFGVIIWYMYSFYDKKAHPQTIEAVNATATTALPQTNTEVIKKDYFGDRIARIEGLPQTAPIYDDLTRPTHVPIPAACMQSKSQGCTCWTQQGTKLQVPLSTCKQIVENGYFIEFDQHDRADERAKRAEPATTSSARSEAIIPSTSYKDAAGLNVKGSPSNDASS